MTVFICCTDDIIIVIYIIACYHIKINTSEAHPTVIILCRNIDARRAPFNKSYYLKAYSDLLLATKNAGADAYFSTREYYAGNGLFTLAYSMSERVSVSEFTEVTNVRADLVYNKGNFADIYDVAVLNPPHVHATTSNKQATYAIFGPYQPLSQLCNNLSDVTVALHNIPGELVVLKQLTGNGGHGVLIRKREDIDLTATNSILAFPLLVQEFLDTEAGIPGMVRGVHDLRIKIGGGEIWGGTLRTPAPGELRANVAQGGTERHLFPEEIPKDAVAISREIDQYFADYPRYYSIDLARTKSGWKLIELNSKPGLSPTDLSSQAAYITKHLAEYLVYLAHDQPAQHQTLS